MCVQTDRQTDRQTERQTDRQTERQTDQIALVRDQNMLRFSSFSMFNLDQVSRPFLTENI